MPSYIQRWKEQLMLRSISFLSHCTSALKVANSLVAAKINACSQIPFFIEIRLPVSEKTPHAIFVEFQNLILLFFEPDSTIILSDNLQKIRFTWIITWNALGKRICAQIPLFRKTCFNCDKIPAGNPRWVCVQLRIESRDSSSAKPRKARISLSITV